MKTPKLNNKEIFCIRSGYEDTNEKYLIYAPLAEIALLASESEVVHLEEIIDQPNDEYQSEDIVSQLCNKSDTVISRNMNPWNTNELTILVNYICNFSCSYCYSAKGRSSKSLSQSTIDAALNFFITAERAKKGKPLLLTFSGGGEPLLSWDKVRRSIGKASKLAQEQNVQLSIGIVSNGSVMSDDIMQVIKSQHVDLVVSFDILREIHDEQRSHYDDVLATLRKLINNGIYPGIRSTITPQNVTLQQTMVKEIKKVLPELKFMAFESVLNKDLYRDENQLAQYYTDFINYHKQAVDYGVKYGIMVGNTVFDSVHSLKERSCLGKFVLTPMSALTSCSRISSSEELFYENFVYGRIDEKGKVEVDQDQFYNCMKHDVTSNPECKSCIAKWHCGGGCLLVRQTYNKKQLEIYCNFYQTAILQFLLTQVQG